MPPPDDPLRMFIAEYWAESKVHECHSGRRHDEYAVAKNCPLDWRGFFGNLGIFALDHYLLLKSIHLLGVVIFLGNIIVTVVWKMLADRTRTPAIVAYAQRLVTLTNIAFTAVGVLLILVTGQLMVARFGGADVAPWIAWGRWLFAASGVIWVAILMPVQVWQARLAKNFAESGDIPVQYWTLSKVWTVFGAAATLLPLANLYVMVFKPT